MDIDESTCANSALRLLRAATAIAQEWHDERVKNIHLLLAICQDPGTSEWLNKVCGFNATIALVEIERLSGTQEYAPSGSPDIIQTVTPLSEELLRVLEHAQSLLETLRFTRINGICLLLGLIAPGAQRDIAQIIETMDLSYDTILAKAREPIRGV